MAVINTNITALIGQQNLNRSQSALQTSMERLSSGLRINSAADDAAGQAIANRMSAQISGLTQAQRNSNDGISVSQTAEGALNQINDNLQRIRTLTVQAQNGTNSGSDLSSIQDEINERLAEINRVSEQTSFNGVNVLAKDQTLSIQVGANDGQTIDIQLKKINAGTLGLDGFNVSGNKVATASDVLGQVQGVALNGSGKVPTASGTVTVGSDTYTALDDGTYTTTASGNAPTSSTTFTTAEVQEKISEFLSANSGSTVAIKTDASTTYTVASDGTVTTGGATAYVSADGSLSTDTSTAATLDPLKALDAALSQVDDLRSNLGAMQNRFESAIENLGTTTTNLSAARSRIQDADYAVEVSNMTRAQILQQAGTSVLAQANQVPQTVLKLLG